MTNKEIENRFTYHPPKDNQPEIYEIIRAYGGDFALYLNKTCPESREKEIAITKLEEAVMWANASIARNE